MNHYLVYIQRNPSFTGETIPGHRDFVSRNMSAGLIKLAGPFGDQNGGAYVFQAESLDQAKQFIQEDPMNNEECIYSIKEWKISL